VALAVADSASVIPRGRVAGAMTSGSGEDASTVPGDPPDPIEIGSRLELFVDDHLVAASSGIERRLQRPRPRGIAIEHDAPWEGRHPNYYVAFEDGDRYRMFYRSGTGDDAGEMTCYAESDDGIEWRKPALGLVEVDGSTENNVVRGDATAHNFTPFRDPTAGADSPARYKAVARSAPDPESAALYAFESPDGFEWSRAREEPIFTADQGAYDSQNVAFWDPHREEYRCYFRYFRDEGALSGRDVKTATSADFLNWSEPRPLGYPDAPTSHQLYTNVVRPYHRAPHLLLGFPARYVEREGATESLRRLPAWESFRAEHVAAGSRTGYALTDTLLMSSRDGESFDVRPRTFLPPGLWDEESTAAWKYGDHYCAWHAVETASTTPGTSRELSLYASEGYRTDDARLRRYSLRIDGFVAVEAGMDGGELRTEPLVFDGGELVVNFATSAGGAVRVELQDAAGRPIEGYTMADAADLFGDDLERRVTWGGDGDVSDLAGEPIRLRIAVVDAELYSFRFR